MGGIPERLELPTDRPRPAMQTFGAEVCHVNLSAELTTGLKQLSRENGATLYMTLLAAFGVLLSRYSGQDDIVVGSPIANRQEVQLEEMIGFFVNTLVMRMRVKGGMSFGELMGEVRKTALEAYRYQDVPFERLVEELSPERSLDRTPVFQVVFAWQNAPMVSKAIEGVGCRTSQRTESAGYVLTWRYMPGRRGPEIQISWRCTTGICLSVGGWSRWRGIT